MSDYLRLMNFACLVRAKPNDWTDASKNTVAKTDRKAFNLRSMLQIAFNQYYDEVNTGGEREELKKLIATIRIKRDLKKDYPGEKIISKVIDKLEEREYFEKPAVEDDSATKNS